MKRLVYVEPPHKVKADFWHFVKYLEEGAGRLSLAPYCTVHRANFDDGKEDEMVAALISVASDCPRFEVECADLAVFGNGIVSVRLQPSVELTGLHKRVIEATAVFLDRGNPIRVEERYENDPRRQELAERFGSVYADEFYEPHVSLCYRRPSFRIDEPDVFKGLRFAVENFSFAVNVDPKTRRYQPTHLFELR